ncbi:hypothetical protein ACWGI8_06050 [Streptomyces sp. NPDC054841]
MAGNEFEGQSLDALYAMIASAKPGELTGAGEALAAAVPKILDIAADLRHYISRVEWEGAGGDAFRKWGAGMVSETLVLGDYTKVVSNEMKRAGQALNEAKAAVPKPAGQCFADPEKEKARIEAETGPKLQEAIHQLERLSSYYEATRDRMGAEREPQFKPVPGYVDVETDERRYGAGASASPSSSYAAAPVTAYEGQQGSARTSVDSSGDRGPAQPSAPFTRPVVPDGNVSTGLDSVAVAPPPEGATRPVPPPVGPTTPVNGGPGIPMPPPPIVAGPPGGPSRIPTPGPVTGNGRGLFPPTGPMGMPPRPGVGDGIVGGKQVPGRGGGSPNSPRLPMGTVVGEERGPLGRGAAGMPGAGSGMHGAPGGGTQPGRRLATQPGGTVGSPRTSAAGSRGTFTPGGTGLVRPASSTTSGNEERRTATTPRPDYLEEDAETWAMGQRKIVPPVID